jgi:putative transposase
MTRGDVAGLLEGERSRRKFDVFLKRPGTYRNAAWEADHVEAAVEVDVEGRLMKPWVTWFVDTEHCVIVGVAVTPRTPNREAILVALRASILRTPPYGPAGGGADDRAYRSGQGLPLAHGERSDGGVRGAGWWICLATPCT